MNGTRLLACHSHTHLAIGQHHEITLGQLVDEGWIITGQFRDIIRLILRYEAKGITSMTLNHIDWKFTQANLWPRQVNQDPDGPTMLKTKLSNILHGSLVFCPLAMSHVEPKHIDSSFHQICQCLQISRHWPHGSNDFCASSL
jgi:hypothetical protein